ncbi:unnamed protein product [Caenorhabditis auriculariae]|uniref:Uncharacterized protein n=1 Tax=Caenorhabditis auriculariae TaxID=2777116 RepID=A0A8S1HNN4_9PELO|nr:unnamed protein product [Caenorhabditis auriculariae]
MTGAICQAAGWPVTRLRLSKEEWSRKLVRMLPPPWLRASFLLHCTLALYIVNTKTVLDLSPSKLEPERQTEEPQVAGAGSRPLVETPDGVNFARDPIFSTTSTSQPFVILSEDDVAADVKEKPTTESAPAPTVPASTISPLLVVTNDVKTSQSSGRIPQGSSEIDHSDIKEAVDETLEIVSENANLMATIASNFAENYSEASEATSSDVATTQATEQNEEDDQNLENVETKDNFVHEMTATITSLEKVPGSEMINPDETFEEGAASPTEAQPGELSEILEISAKDQVEIEEALIDLLHIFIILAPAVNERQIFRWWRVISEAIQCSLRDCRAALASRKSAQTVVKLPGVIRRRREAKPCPCRDFERHLAAL